MQAGRDLKYISTTMTGCFALGGLALMVLFLADPLPCYHVSTFFVSPANFIIHFSVCCAQLFKAQGLGLVGCWSALVGFQWVTVFHSPSFCVFIFLAMPNKSPHHDVQARFFLAIHRLLSARGVLFSDDLDRYRLAKLKAT